MQSSKKVVVAVAAAITALSATGMGASVLPNSATQANRRTVGDATASEPPAAAAAAAGGVGAGAPPHSVTLAGVSGGVAGVHQFSGASGGVVADAGSNLVDPAGSPMGDGPLSDAVSPVHAVTATLAQPKAKAPVEVRTVSSVPAAPAPAKTKTTAKSADSGSGSAPVAPVSPPIVLSGDQPGPANTGVPAGTALTVMNGNLTITTAGATYSGLDVHGFVSVQAPNVTIKNSIIRGGVAPADIGLVNDIDASATNFLIEDSELVPMDPSVQIDGIKGWNYTVLRVEIHGTTDGAKIFGPNATIENSYIHGLVTYAHDPDQGGKQSHNDGVQILSGSNIKIVGNTIQGGSNTALMITQDHGVTNNVVFDNNWVSGGACTVNMTPKPLGSLNAITVDNNIFIDNSTAHCPILDTTATNLTAVGNVFAGSGLPVPINNKGAN